MGPQLHFALVIALLHSGALFLFWGSFSLLFRLGVAPRFQVQGGKPPDSALSRRAIREVVTGQLLFAPLCYALVYPLWVRAGGSFGAAWSAPQLALQLAVFIAFEDTIFYWSHRLLHTRFLFRHVHARHHRFRHVRGFVAEFSHPLENAMNFVAFFAGPVALGSPFAIVAIWIVVRMFETVEAHSGYAFSSVSSRHSFHHLHAQRGCYGSFFAPWDFMMGTDKQWREWRRTRSAA